MHVVVIVGIVSKKVYSILDNMVSCWYKKLFYDCTFYWQNRWYKLYM